jgi:hypothetical protein
MSCDESATTAGQIAVMASKVPQRGFKEALAEVKKAGRPLTLDVAEAAMDELGGASQLGRMMAEDLKKLRGEGLSEEQMVFHEVDYKTVKGLYEALIRLATERDKMVGETGDPLDGISEQDLLAIASQAASLRVEADPDYRRQIMQQVLELDHNLILEFAGLALDIVDSGPKVEVLNVD